MLLVGVYVLAITVLPAQYYFRYVLISKQRPLSLLKTMGLFSISLGTALLDSLISFPTFAYSGTVRPDFDYCSIWTQETPCPQIVVGDIRYWPMQIYFLYAGLMIQTSYGLAVYFGYKTVRTMQSALQSSMVVNSKTQINRVLLIQSILPLINAVTPLTLAVVGTFFYWDLGNTLAWMNAAFPLLPVLNSASTILFVSPYRQFLFGHIPGMKRFRSSSVYHAGATSGASQQPVTVMSNNFVSA
ncbi:hypothetical protein M3Y99_01741200 [Aphelenchoides fujianensis]|nr:hypothetical protein M3Y99_01741200 [Aphelenchoides fujianensis]